MNFCNLFDLSSCHLSAFAITSSDWNVISNDWNAISTDWNVILDWLKCHRLLKFCSYLCLSITETCLRSVGCFLIMAFHWSLSFKNSFKFWFILLVSKYPCLLTPFGIFKMWFVPVIIIIITSACIKPMRIFTCCKLIFTSFYHEVTCDVC